MSGGRSLFCRGEEDPVEHDDIWEDSALIEAYDRALANARAELGMAGGGGDGKPAGARSAITWQQGDFCVADYDEDSLPYEAVIVSLQGRSAQLEFLGYGNQQRTRLSRLRPSAGKKARTQQRRQAEPDMSPDLETAGAADPEISPECVSAPAAQLETDGQAEGSCQQQSGESHEGEEEPALDGPARHSDSPPPPPHHWAPSQPLLNGETPRGGTAPPRAAWGPPHMATGVPHVAATAPAWWL